MVVVRAETIMQLLLLMADQGEVPHTTEPLVMAHLHKVMVAEAICNLVMDMVTEAVEVLQQ